MRSRPPLLWCVPTRALFSCLMSRRNASPLRSNAGSTDPSWNSFPVCVTQIRHAARRCNRWNLLSSRT